MRLDGRSSFSATALHGLNNHMAEPRPCPSLAGNHASGGVCAAQHQWAVWWSPAGQGKGPHSCVQCLMDGEQTDRAHFLIGAAEWRTEMVSPSASQAEAAEAETWHVPAVDTFLVPSVTWQWRSAERGAPPAAVTPLLLCSLQYAATRSTASRRTDAERQGGWEDIQHA